MRTTLNRIRVHHPCRDGWEKLLSFLDKTQPDDEPLLLETILDANGLDDALWCLRAVEGHDREIRLYLIWCVRQVQHLTTDPRSGAALDVAERYARGQASREELDAASASAAAAWAEAKARVAAWVAASAARAASAAPASAAWGAAAWEVAAWEVAWEVARESTWTQSVRVAREVAAAREQAAIDARATELRRVCREIDSGRDPYPMEAKP